jgi:transposase-like protein
VAERGVVVTHESIHRCCLKFGADFGRLRWRRPQPDDTWHLDEVFIRVRGALHYLWRAADQRGVVLDILVQDRRNGAAAKCFFKRLLQGMKYKPRRLVTDRLRSYGVARRTVMPNVRHRTSRYLNNRAENLHRDPRDDDSGRCSDSNRLIRHNGSCCRWRQESADRRRGMILSVPATCAAVAAWRCETALRFERGDGLMGRWIAG